MNPTHPLQEIDENGDPFEVWVVLQSFGLLAPLCRLGLIAAAVFLLVVDPLYFLGERWSPAIPQTYLVTWHATMLMLFAGVGMLAHRPHAHATRLRILQGFFLGTSVLFIWFGVVSWIATGDLSVVAIATLVHAAVLQFPGHLRRRWYGVQALALVGALAWWDASGQFLDKLQFVNLVLLAAVASAIDGHMMKRARSLFTEKCKVVQERQRADGVLYNAMPLAVANALKTEGRVKAQRYPAMTILFADIVGFTAFAASHSPEAVLSALSDIFSDMDALADQFQVEKIKTMGDAYMAVSATQPAAIAHWALAMQHHIEAHRTRHHYPFELRIGVHCGPTIAGVIGSKRLQYDVWSDAVNTASRMESSGTPGRIHVSEALYLALREQFDFQDRGLSAIKGMGLMHTYFLQRAGAR